MIQTSLDGIDVQTTMLTVSDGTTMPAYVARPAQADGPRPGLLLFQEAFGVNAHIRDLAARFAHEGYVTIAPALFHRTEADFEGSYTDFGAARTHMAALTEAGLSADAQAAYEWLTSQDGGQASAVGSTGYCLGGRVSFLANSRLPLQAAVSYYGGGIAPDLLGRAPEQRAPLLLFWGGLDAHIGVDKRRMVEAALIGADKPYTQVTFSQADHGFFCDARASYNPDAARQAWALTLAFFESHLSPAGQP